MSKVLKRFYLVLIMVGVGWVGLAARLIYLQVRYRELRRTMDMPSGRICAK